jgi:hypothetical protein
MSDRIVIDGIEPEQFDKLVDLLAKWTSRGKVKVRFQPPEQIRLDFVENQISQELKHHGLPESCISQLRSDIPLMLTGILAGYRPRITNFLAEHSDEMQSEDEPRPDKEEIVNEVAARILRLEENVVTSDLTRQYAIKRTTKNNTFLGASWDIVEKRSESSGNPPSNLVYATMRITTQKPPIRSSEAGFLFLPFSFDLANPPSYEDLTLTMTFEDLQDLAETLGNASKELDKLIQDQG